MRLKARQLEAIKATSFTLRPSTYALVGVGQLSSPSVVNVVSATDNTGYSSHDIGSSLDPLGLQNNPVCLLGKGEKSLVLFEI